MRKFYNTLITDIGIDAIVLSLFAKLPMSPSHGQAMTIVYVAYQEITPQPYH